MRESGQPGRRHFFDSGNYKEQYDRGRDAPEPSPTLRTTTPAAPPELQDDDDRPWCLEPKQRITEMLKTVKSKAEAQFTATQKKEEQVRKERETEQREKSEHVAKLRALRLAKEAEDKLAADKAAAEKAAAKTKKSSALPKTHRRKS